MSQQQYLPKTARTSLKPAFDLWQPRPFAPPPTHTPPSPPPDLQTQLENAKQFGHSLKTISLSTPQASVTIQPQQTISQSPQDLGLQPAIHSVQRMPILQRQSQEAVAQAPPLPTTESKPSILQKKSPLLPQLDPEQLAPQFPELQAIQEPFFDGKEEHHLFLEVQDQSYVLMIASSPKLLKDYLASQGSNLKAKNESVYQELETLIEQFNQVSSGFKEDLGKYLNTLFKKAVNIMKTVGIGKGGYAYIPPETKVTWGAAQTSKNRQQVGTSMTANPLSIDPGSYAGSEPRDQYGTRHVKGHLLNHHLHGPATPKNLTPMTQTMNTSFEKQVENFLKQKILAENLVFRYTVKAKNFDADHFEPQYIEYKAQELEKDTLNKWVDKTNGWSIQGSLDQEGNGTTTISGGVDKKTSEEEEIQEMDFENALSDPVFLSAFIEREDTPANLELEAIEEEYQKIMYEWSAEFGEYLRDLLKQIVNKLKLLAPETLQFLPESQIVYGPTKKFKNVEGVEFGHFSDEHGTWMEAKLLSINPGSHKGYEPETQRWGNLVQGHLLNHHLHGPAESKNLVPISNSLNQQMERDIESTAKKWVLEEGKVVYYKVWTDSDYQLDESEIILGKTIEEDYEIPASPPITFDDPMLEEKEFKDKLKKWELKRQEEEEKYHNLPDYFVPGGLHAELQELKLKNGVDASDETQINEPDNWEGVGQKIVNSWANSLQQKAKEEKKQNKRKKVTSDLEESEEVLGTKSKRIKKETPRKKSSKVDKKPLSKKKNKSSSLK
jgi:arsenate reductase-like glutaredoxin family protein